MISVITPTIRTVDLNASCLKKQVYRDFEWVVVSPYKADKLFEDISQVPFLTLISEPEKRKNDIWGFNKAMNKAILWARGDLIVSYQDLIWIPPDALEKFAFHYKNDPRSCVTGVGHIYSDLDENEKPINQVWEDPRIRTDLGTFYPCMANDWELNFCSAPKKAFYDIGGFDEELDTHFGMDNISICERMDAVGYKFFIDQSNICRGLKHGRPKDWDEKHAMRGFYQERKSQLIKDGKWPKLSYLKNG